MESDDETEFRDERQVGERVSYRARTDDDVEKKYDPVRSFRDSVEAIALEIKDRFPKLLGADDVNYLMDKISIVNKPGYKNSSCYILGYIATKGNRKDIDGEMLNILYRTVVPTMLDSSIKKEDIIRYSNLWIQHLY